VAASHHGDTPYSGNSVTSVPVTPYTTSVDVNFTVALRGARDDAHLRAGVSWPELALTPGYMTVDGPGGG
jgi:hypothetical protein